jgi:hypothetical protein
VCSLALLPLPLAEISAATLDFEVRTATLDLRTLD